MPTAMPQTPTLDERMSHVEQDLAELKSRIEYTNPWLEGAGMFRDDPLFDDWQRQIAEYRQVVDRSAGTP